MLVDPDGERAANGREAIELVAEHRPDAILLDLHMPVLDGIEATRLLTEQQPEVAIVVLTTYDDDVSVLAALGAGARSYLTKDADRVDIANALRGAATGLSVLDSAIQATLVAAALPQRQHRQKPHQPHLHQDRLPRPGNRRSLRPRTPLRVTGRRRTQSATGRFGVE